MIKYFWCSHELYAIIGNIETLSEIPKQEGINVRESLLKFHQKWYSANVMSLVVLGKGKESIVF